VTTQINRIGPGAPSITANSGETEVTPRATTENHGIDHRRTASRQRLGQLASSFDHTAGKILLGVAAAPFVIAGGLATVAVHSGLSLAATPFTIIRDMFKGRQDPVKELTRREESRLPKDISLLAPPKLAKSEEPSEIAKANRYIIAGAKIIEALGKADSAHTATVSVQDGSVPIRPNIQTIRAVIWYLKAKALTGRKENINDLTPKLSESGNSDHLIVSGELASRLYRFLESAPTTYNRNGLFGKLFRGRQQQQERGIEDFSNQLPQGKGAVVFDLKNGQLHLKLETAGTPSLFGTSRHSDTSWTASVWRSLITPFRNLRHLWNRARSKNQAAAEVSLKASTPSRDAQPLQSFLTTTENRRHGEIRLEQGAVQLKNTGWFRRKLKNWFVKSDVRQQREKAQSAFRQALLQHLETYQRVQKNEKLSRFFLGTNARPLNSEKLADFLLNPAYKRGYLKTKDVTYIRNVINSDRLGMIEHMREILNDPRFQDKLRELDRSWWQKVRLTGGISQLPVISQLKDLGGAIQAGRIQGKLGEIIARIEDHETNDNVQMLLLIAETLKNHYKMTRNTRLASTLLSGAALGAGIGLFGLQSNIVARQLTSLVSGGSGTSSFAIPNLNRAIPTAALRSIPTVATFAGTSAVRWASQNIPDYLFRAMRQDYHTALAMLSTLPPASAAWPDEETQLLRDLRQAVGLGNDETGE